MRFLLFFLSIGLLHGLLRAEELVDLPVSGQMISVQELVVEDKPVVMAEVKEKNADVCSLCWHSFAEIDPVILSPCKHVLCATCIQDWFFKSKKNVCPICNKKVRKIGEQELEPSVQDPRSFFERVRVHHEYMMQQVSGHDDLYSVIDDITALKHYHSPLVLRDKINILQHTMFHELCLTTSVATNELYQEIRAGFVVEGVSQTSKIVRDFLVDSLSKLDNHIRYWEDQLKSPISYFFHKSPHKWFAGKKQEREVYDNLVHLRKLQKKYFVHLGHLNSYLNTFDSDLVFEELYKWMDGAMVLMKNIVHDDDSSQLTTTVTIDMLCDDMKQVLLMVPEAVQHLDREITNYACPHHLERHWLFYTIGIGATAFGLWYWYKHPDVVNNGQAGIKNFFKGLWEKAKEGKDNIANYLWPVDKKNVPPPNVSNVNNGANNNVADKTATERVDDFFASFEKEGTTLINHWKPIIERYKADHGDSSKTLEQEYVKAVSAVFSKDDNLRKFFNQDTLKAYKDWEKYGVLGQATIDDAFIVNAAKALDINFIKVLIHKKITLIDGKVEAFSRVDWGVTNVLSKLTDLQKLFGNDASLISLGSIFLQIKERELMQLGQGGITFLENMQKPATGMLDILKPRIKDGLKAYDEGIKQSGLVFGVMALGVPTLTLYGTYKLIARLRHYTIKPFELALDDMQRILNKYSAQLSSEHEGQIVYYAQRMKKYTAAMPRYIPHETRGRIIADIRELESPMTVVQKLTVIERLRDYLRRIFPE